MAIPVMVIGRSGSGKSTSLRNFEKDEVALINILGKALPFDKKFDSTQQTDDYQKIKELLLRTEKKSIVLDDFTYAMVNQWMRGKDGGGNKFDLFDDIGSKPWQLLEFIRSRLPDDKIVYFMMQEDYDDRNGVSYVKPRTIGRMIDDKVCLEGMFTIVLQAKVNDGNYTFQTHSLNGEDVTKSPLKMWEEDFIDNDLKAVDSVIRAYYKLPGLKNGKEA